MNTVASFDTMDRRPPDGLASWYTPGVTDGFGDRLLMFDNTPSDALELLRFHASLVATPGFEEGLHHDVQRLGQLAHAAFPAVRGVERLESDGSLVLVSAYTPGTRLSAFFGERQSGKRFHPAFVISVVSQIMQPISVLQAAREHAVHGALTADRIILGPDGRIHVVEHVLGSALRRLERSPAQLWQEFGLLVPDHQRGAAELDARDDVFQTGVLALSMLLARRVSPTDLEHLPRLLDEWHQAATAGSQMFAAPLRQWLERALQIDGCPYPSAAEAHVHLPSLSPSRAFELLQVEGVDVASTPRLTPESTVPASRQEAPMANRSSLNENPMDESHQLPGATPGTPQDNLVGPVEDGASDVADMRVARRASRFFALPPGQGVAAVDLPGVPARTPDGEFKSYRSRFPVALGLTAVALVQGVVIALLLLRSSPELVPSAVTASPTREISSRPIEAEVTPFSPDIAGIVGLDKLAKTASSEGAAPPPETVPIVGREENDLAAIARAPAKPRSGGVRLSAPIELNVLQGDRVLGSASDGPIVMAAGSHELDFINSSLGVRIRRAVTFRAGEITTLKIPVPSGRISVNAAPWAEVWIDGRRVGETPLANLEIPIGDHEIVFRHPELGERRQNLTVRADAVARVSARFEQ